MTEQWWSDDTVLRVAKALALSDLSSTAIPFGELSSRAQAAHLNAARVALAAVSSPQGVSCFLCGAGPNPDAVVWHSVFPGMVICRRCRDAKDMAANRPHARAEAFEEAKRIVSALYKNPKRYESQYDEGFDCAIDLAEQALDRASTAPEAT